MKRILYLAIEPPWPTNQGGRVRMAGTIQALRTTHHVTVGTWRRDHMEATPDDMVVLPGAEQGSRFTGFASWAPRIMHQIAGPAGIAAASGLAQASTFDVVMFSHSYVAAAVPTTGLLRVVDFANLEHRRYQAFAEAGGSAINRLSARLEYAKARRWEPRVARDADLSIALSESDESWLRSCGGTTVLTPNAIESAHAQPSSPDGPALFLGSLDYEPNRLAAQFLIQDVWPAVLGELPNARLRIAGRGSLEALGANPGPGIDVVGAVDSLEAEYARSALVLAPVATGAGRQLKVLEALAHGRTLVATPYSAESVPEPLKPGIVIARDQDDFASAVVRCLADHPRRTQLESFVAQHEQALPTWANVVRPLTTWIESHA